MYKFKLLSDPESCLVKAKADEPLFVLRANDPIAAETVMFWVRRAGEGTDHSPEKRAAARKIAAEMGAWRNRNVTSQHKRWLFFSDLASNSALWDVPLVSFREVEIRSRNDDFWRPWCEYKGLSFYAAKTARDWGDLAEIRCIV